MARVVQKNSPPYLLIVFVFLFLISTALAVLFFIQYSKAKTSEEQFRAEHAAVISPDEAAQAEMENRIQKYNNAPRNNKQTVVHQMDADIADLTRYITGTSASYEEAKASAEKVPGIAAGLIHLVSQAQADKLAAQKARDEALQKVADGEKKVAEMLEDLAKAKKDFQDQLAQRDEKITNLDAKVQANSKNYREELSRLETQHKETANRLNKIIATKTTEVAQLESEVQRWKRMYNELQTITSNEPEKKIPVRTTPDGKILRVVDQVCYIDIGKQDNVVPGLTFSVYPATGVPEDGKGKGSIVVTSVNPTTSECQIVGRDKSDPIVVGDLISNLAFDAMQTYTFVVAGMFDLSGKDNPTAAGTEEVKNLLKRYGAKIADKVTVDTDFVVMGKEPEMPRRPNDTDPPAVLKVYEEQMKMRERYEEIQKQAIDLHKPILNTNSFLSYIGYMKAGRKEPLSP